MRSGRFGIGSRERFGHDPSKLVSYYMEMQKQYEDRLIKTGKSAECMDPKDNG